VVWGKPAMMSEPGPSRTLRHSPGAPSPCTASQCNQRRKQTMNRLQSTHAYGCHRVSFIFHAEQGRKCNQSRL
jgi:hypothetical protein